MSSATSVPNGGAPITPQVPRGASAVDRLAQHGRHAGRLDAKSAPQPVMRRISSPASRSRASIDVRRAELARELEPRGHAVDADDRPAAGDDAGHHRGEPDGAGAEDGERAAGRRPQRRPAPAGAGLDAAAERRRELERDRVGELDDVASPATQCVAKHDWPKKCAWISSPSRDSALVPSGRAAAKLGPKKSWQ